MPGAAEHEEEGSVKRPAVAEHEKAGHEKKKEEPTPKKRPPAAEKKEAGSKPKKPRSASCDAAPPCPKEHWSILYNRGKIYTNINTKMFRIYNDTSVVSSDVKRSWSGDKPTSVEWKGVLAINGTHWERCSRNASCCAWTAAWG